MISCADSRKRSYLYSLVTEEQTLLCGDYTQNGKSPAEEDIYYDLRGVDIDFSLDDYVFERAEENDTESIEKVESCLQELFPGLSLDMYERKMITGGAGQNQFCYEVKDGNSDKDDFFGPPIYRIPIL